MDYKVTIYEKRGMIAKSTLNRPEKLNAANSEMFDELLDQISDVAKDENIRVWIVTGAGRGFCAGDDLDRLKKLYGDEAGKPSLPRPAGRLPLPLRSLEKPTIAMVNGPAVGMGFELALVCDFIIASETARFGEVYLQRGIVPSAGTWLLPRMVGLKKAAEILLLADIFDAKEAERLGLVYKVVARDQLETETMVLANRLANMAPIALRFAKHAIAHGLEWNLETTLDYVSYARNVVERFREVPEGVAAFEEKRAAKF